MFLIFPSIVRYTPVIFLCTPVFFSFFALVCEKKYLSFILCCWEYITDSSLMVPLFFRLTLTRWFVLFCFLVVDSILLCPPSRSLLIECYSKLLHCRFFLTCFCLAVTGLLFLTCVFTSTYHLLVSRLLFSSCWFRLAAFILLIPSSRFQPVGSA